LGLSPTNANGHVVDAWGNPIRYAIYAADIPTTSGTSNPFTGTDKMRTITMNVLANNGSVRRKFLYVCDSEGVVTGADCGTAQTIADGAVAVVYSQGRNGNVSMSALENENTDNDKIFIGGTNKSNFDDIVTSLSLNLIFNRLIASGRLP
jgi:hypothetical protein